MTDAQQVVDEVFGLYRQYGTDDYIGEPVSQIEHMSQAAQLALSEGCDDEVVLAAFFHDIGHFCGKDAKNMDGYGVVSHERVGLITCAEQASANGWPSWWNTTYRPNAT